MIKLLSVLANLLGPVLIKTAFISIQTLYSNNLKYFILLKLGVFCETEVTPTTTTTTTSSISSVMLAEFCPIGIIIYILIVPDNDNIMQILFAL